MRFFGIRRYSIVTGCIKSGGRRDNLPIYDRIIKTLGGEEEFITAFPTMPPPCVTV